MCAWKLRNTLSFHCRSSTVNPSKGHGPFASSLQMQKCPSWQFQHATLCHPVKLQSFAALGSPTILASRNGGCCHHPGWSLKPTKCFILLGFATNSSLVRPPASWWQWWPTLNLLSVTLSWVIGVRLCTEIMLIANGNLILDRWQNWSFLVFLNCLKHWPAPSVMAMVMPNHEHAFVVFFLSVRAICALKWFW